MRSAGQLVVCHIACRLHPTSNRLKTSLSISSFCTEDRAAMLNHQPRSAAAALAAAAHHRVECWLSSGHCTEVYAAESSANQDATVAEDL